MGERRNVCRVLVEKPVGKRLLRKPRRRWEMILKWVFKKYDGSLYCLENLGVDGRIILKWIFKKYNGSFYWIVLAQERDKWWTVLHTVMRLRHPKVQGIS